MMIDSSRLGNAPDTLSKTGWRLSGSRASVLPSDLNAAPTSASGFRIDRRRARDRLRVDHRDAPFPAVVGSLALRQRRGSSVGLQREELGDEDLAAVGGDGDAVGLGCRRPSIVLTTLVRLVSMTDTVSEDWLAT